MAEHIKWQKTANKKYFGSWDLPDDGKDLIVTIEDVKREMVQNQQGADAILLIMRQVTQFSTTVSALTLYNRLQSFPAEELWDIPSACLKKTKPAFTRAF